MPCTQNQMGAFLLLPIHLDDLFMFILTSINTASVKPIKTQMLSRYILMF